MGKGRKGIAGSPTHPVQVLRGQTARFIDLVFGIGRKGRRRKWMRRSKEGQEGKNKRYKRQREGREWERRGNEKKE